MPKPCTKCGVCDKAPGKQKCHECALAEQAPEIQEYDAVRRRNCVPEEARRARVPAALWPEGRRWCADCQSFRRLSDCSGSRCKTCLGAANWDAYLRRTYVIHNRPFTADDYWRLFKVQRGRCRLCGKRSIAKRMATDHDHETGQVRGLLCPGSEWGCNYRILGVITGPEQAYNIWQYLLHNYAESVITE